MQHAAPIFGERKEEVAAASGLIMGSTNCQTRIVTEKRGADRAVADEEHIPNSISS
jgi:hypothetical protein